MWGGGKREIGKGDKVREWSREERRNGDRVKGISGGSSISE